MPAVRYNLVWVQGTPFRKAFAAKVGTATGPAKNLAGWSAVLQGRRRTSDPKPMVTLASGESPFISIDEEEGTVFLDFPGEFSTLVPFTRGVYGINLIDPEGNAVPFLEGSWTIRPRAIR